MSYRPSPYGVASDVATLTACRDRQIVMCETAAARRHESEARRNWHHLELVILDTITGRLAEAQRLLDAEPERTCTVHGDDACGTGLDPVGAQDCDEATLASGLVRCGTCGAVVLAHLVATHAMRDHAEVAR